MDETRRSLLRIGLAAAAVITVMVAGIIVSGSKADQEAARFAATAPGSTQTASAIPRVIADLNALPIKGKAAATGYSRDRFGPAWTDKNTVADGGNGCDTRNDILAAQLQHVAKAGNCIVASGDLVPDPYTGKVIAWTRGPRSADVQIDHMVALKDAWLTGAQYPQLSPAQAQARRVNLANDPINLQAVDGPTNEAKGDGDFATWKPPQRSYWCTYATRQVEVKKIYELWVTKAEHDALLAALQACPGAP